MRMWSPNDPTARDVRSGRTPGGGQRAVYLTSSSMENKVSNRGSGTRNAPGYSSFLPRSTTDVQFKCTSKICTVNKCHCSSHPTHASPSHPSQSQVSGSLIHVKPFKFPTVSWIGMVTSFHHGRRGLFSDSFCS